MYNFAVFTVTKLVKVFTVTEFGKGYFSI
jgi:hypothetical protein